MVMTFTEGVRLAGLKLREANASAMVLRYAGMPVTNDGYMTPEDVERLIELHSVALDSYKNTIIATHERGLRVRRTGWTHFREAGHRLRGQLEGIPK